MKQTERNIKGLQKEKNIAESVEKMEASSELHEGKSDDNSTSHKVSPESLLVLEEITELLSNEDIVGAVKKFKADSQEKEIAVEFTNSHIQFLNQIVESDYIKGVARTDVEIRDVVSHVNILLKKRNEYLFITMIMHSPSHYRNIQKRYYAKMKKEEENKEKNN